MRKSVLLLFITLSVLAFGQKPVNTDKAQINKKVTQLLSKMTIEEKVGQMTQVALDVVSSKLGNKNQKHELNEKALEEAILKYHVGSILNVASMANSVDYWQELITKIQDVAVKKSRLSIPVIYGIDAIHGATYTLNSTLFPQAISMAATFNKELSYNAGTITAREVRACGIPWNFNPVMDLGRHVVWPRFWETYGEDSYLSSVLGSEYIKGSQGDNTAANDKVMTCLKHYVGYGFPSNGRDRSPVLMSERTLRELYLPGFEAGIKAGAMTVMVHSGEVDGIPTHSDYRLLTEILRGELKFEGVVVSDWEDIKRLYTRDRVASSPEEAVKMAVMAGVDMSMVPMDYSFYDILLGLVRSKEVPVKRIDEAVSRILKVKFMLGLFENAYPDKNLKSAVHTKNSDDMNLMAASESVVLTQNKGNLLPLKNPKKILVTGPTANMLSVMNGGWTITWQGNEESLYPQENNTVLEALQAKYGKENVIYSEGTSFDKDINTDKTVELAKSSDAVVVCLGEPAYCETPGNIDELQLDDIQLRLAEELNKVNKSVVLVLLQGRPRVIRKIVDQTPAILVAMLPGMRGGDAIANIISGETVPSGKLPFSYPKFSNALYHYDHKPLESANELKYDPQWGFGHGLSYTSFEYSNLKLDKNAYTKNEKIEVTVDVKNCGSISAKEAVLLYICDLYGSVSRPVRQLRGAEKVMLQPGETKTVKFALEQKDLSFISRDNKRIVEPGEFTVYVDKLEQKFILK